MRVLLVSTYEMGHQPLHLASPAAALIARGHEVRCRDTSLEPLKRTDIEWADALGFSVPMHTAMRLAVQAAHMVKEVRPDLPIAFYGLYASIGRDPRVAESSDAVFSGEYEPALCTWVGSLSSGAPAAPEVISLARSPFSIPRRDLLPGLERYAHLALDGEERSVGYVEASHGCSFECLHCPVPVVYGGRIRTVPRESVLADIEQLVGVGARHITFGDPDFLNGWKHSLTLVEEMHASWPHLTFDATTKVELILRHAGSWNRFAAAGCLFVVSAFECVDDETLERLDKGHSTADAAEAIGVLRSAGIEIRPSFLPFTPWTTLQHVGDLLDFVAVHDLIGNVDPVQYSIRLLIPEGSLLLGHPDLEGRIDGYDADLLTYRWASPDPRVDELQRRIAKIAEVAGSEERPPGAAYLEIRAATSELGASLVPAVETPTMGSIEGRPRLTEPWFC